MAARNPDSVTNQGEFHARRPHNERKYRGSHQLGTRHAPADYAPEFHARTLPAGSAPPDKTFTPQIGGSVLDDGVDTHDNSAAGDFTGSTSQGVHQGLGHPGQGQTSSELRHDGQQKRKNPGQGLVQYGATSVPGKEGVDSGSVNTKEEDAERLGEGRGKPGEKGTGA